MVIFFSIIKENKREVLSLLWEKTVAKTMKQVIVGDRDQILPYNFFDHICLDDSG